MVDIVFELIINLFQSILFIGFLSLFFDRKYKTSTNSILFGIFCLSFFGLLTYFTFNQMFFMMFDVILGIIICEAYTLLCLKGNTKMRVILPFIMFLINTIIAYIFLYSTSLFTGITFEKIAISSGIYRYICVIIINLTNLVVFVSLLKINSKSYNLKKITDVIAFVGIPILTMTVIYLTVFMSIIAGYKEKLIPYVIAICISMIVIAIVVWYMISKISKDNDIKTQLLTTKLKATMYERNIIRVNAQINKMSDIKHDMKNNIACINDLVVNGDFEEAKNLCGNLIKNMETVYTPVNTGNPILNAVINVEQEKAQNNDIDLRLVIENSMIELKGNTDLISLIGNLCDNAIEYLKGLPIEHRKMELHITKHNDYNIIVCKNIINSSILNSNPNLKSNKEDKSNHGKGLNIIKSIVNNYNGTLNFIEKEDWFIATIIF